MKLNEGERADRLYERHSRSEAHWSEFAIAEQDRREGPLVEALRSIGHGEISARGGSLADVELVARQALAQWEALDAKPEPAIINLRGAVDEIERECPGRVVTMSKDSHAWRVIQIAARGKSAVDAKSVPMGTRTPRQSFDAYLRHESTDTLRDLLRDLVGAVERQEVKP